MKQIELRLFVIAANTEKSISLRLATRTKSISEKNEHLWEQSSLSLDVHVSNIIYDEMPHTGLKRLPSKFNVKLVATSTRQC